jgi:rRNA maturation endonuclease Nob1
MGTQMQIEKNRIGRSRRDSRSREDFDRIKCRGCGRTYPALDGPALLYSLKATCPHCGGGFEMAI